MRIVAKQITTEVKLPDPEDVILTVTDSGPGSEPPHQKNLVMTSSVDPSFSLNVTDMVDEQTKADLEALITNLCTLAEVAVTDELEAKSAEVATKVPVRP